jgi:hypothetical protein
VAVWLIFDNARGGDPFDARFGEGPARRYNRASEPDHGHQIRR